MAKRVITVLTDDLTGGKADETVEFSVDGVRYEIDLSDVNAKGFREMLTPYVEAGTKMSNHSGRPAKDGWLHQGGGTRTGADKAANKAHRVKQRAWWAANWEAADLKEPTDRGRIPSDVEAAYDKHGGQPVVTAPAPAPVVVVDDKPAKAPTPRKPAKAAPKAAFQPATTPAADGKVTRTRGVTSLKRATGSKTAAKKATTAKG